MNIFRHYVIVDEKKFAVVLVIRGTFSYSGLKVDLERLDGKYSC